MFRLPMAQARPIYPLTGRCKPAFHADRDEFCTIRCHPTRAATHFPGGFTSAKGHFTWSSSRLLHAEILPSVPRRPCGAARTEAPNER
jgi:hypothetical protein